MVAFLPLIAGFAGSFLPGIIDALASSKTKEEAAAILAPEIDSKVAELVGRGVRRDEAEAQVMESMQSAIQSKMQEGSLPAWAEMGLGLITGLGSGAAAAKFAGKMGKKALAKADVTAKAAAPVAAKADDGLKAPFGPKEASALEPKPYRADMEMPHGKPPLDRGIDDGSEAVMQSLPERGLAAPFRRFDAEMAPPSSGRAPRPIREVEPISVRDSDETLSLGMDPRSMPMSEAEALAREAAQSARRSPRQIATSRPQPRLGYEEPYTPEPRLRNPFTGAPDQPRGFDPLTGAPIY